MPITISFKSPSEWLSGGGSGGGGSAARMEKAKELMGAGNEAFINEDYRGALRLFEEAVALEPGNAAHLAKRSHCKCKLNDFVGAVEDAHAAVLLKPTLGRAYLRKGIAQYNLAQWRMAQEAFAAGLEQDNTSKEHTELEKWAARCEARMAEEGAGTGESEEEDEVNGSLPAGWEQKRTRSGKRYFVDHNEGRTHWIVPEALASERQRGAARKRSNSLPYGWEKRLDKQGEPYFIDHASMSTTRLDPRRRDQSAAEQQLQRDHERDMSAQLDREGLRACAEAYASAIERQALLQAVQFSIRELLAHCVGDGNSYDATSFDGKNDVDWLTEFMAVLEECLCHGLKPVRGADKLCFWGFMERVCRCFPRPSQIINTVVEAKKLSGVWKGRVWMVLALIRKQLVDYVQCALHEESLLRQFYEPHALLRSEEGHVMAGMLLGLSTIDFCPSLCIKGNWNQASMHRRGYVNYAVFLQGGAGGGEDEPGDEGEEGGEAAAAAAAAASRVPDEQCTNADVLRSRLHKLERRLADAGREVVTRRRSSDDMVQSLGYYKTKIAEVKRRESDGRLGSPTGSGPGTPTRAHAKQIDLGDDDDLLVAL